MASTFFKKRAEKIKADKLPSENKSTDELLKTLETAEQEEAVQDDKPKQKETVKQEVAPAPSKVIQTGYNVFFDSSLKKYMLVYLEYSPDAISAQVVKMEPIADNMAVALKKLSDKIALKLMRHEEDV